VYNQYTRRGKGIVVVRVENAQAERALAGFGQAIRGSNRKVADARPGTWRLPLKRCNASLQLAAAGQMTLLQYTNETATLLRSQRSSRRARLASQGLLWKILISFHRQQLAALPSYRAQTHPSSVTVSALLQPLPWSITRCRLQRRHPCSEQRGWATMP